MGIIKLFTRNDDLLIGFINNPEYEKIYTGNNKFGNALLDLFDDLDLCEFEPTKVQDILKLYCDDICKYMNKLKKFKNIKMNLNKNLIKIENVCFGIDDWGFELYEVKDKIIKSGEEMKINKALNEREIEIIKGISNNPYCRYRDKKLKLVTIGTPFYGSWGIEKLKNPIFNNIEQFEDEILTSSIIISTDNGYSWVQFKDKQYYAYTDKNEKISEYIAFQIINAIINPECNLENIREIPTFEKINKVYDEMGIPQEQKEFFNKNNLNLDFFTNNCGKKKALKEFYINKYPELNLKDIMLSDDCDENPFTNTNSDKYINFQKEINSHINEYEDLITGSFDDFPEVNESEYFDIYFGTNTSESHIEFLFGKDKNTNIIFLIRMVGYGWGPGMYS